MYFQAKLATPASPGSTKQGTSESTAILLDDVKAENFARFLWVFYNSSVLCLSLRSYQYHFFRKYSLYDASVEDWTAILDLAHRWTFPEVKSLCVRELEKLEMDDINRIVAYHKYEVDRTLLIPRYAALCQREQTLTLEEGMSLGMETTLNIVRARECARAKPSLDGIRSPVPIDIDNREMNSLIKDLFGIAGPSTEPVPPPTAAVNGTAATTNGTGTSGTATPVAKPAGMNFVSSSPVHTYKRDLGSKPAPKLDIAKPNGSTSDTAKTNTEASKTNGDTSKPNAEASKPNGDPDADAAKAVGDEKSDATKVNGDNAAPLVDTASATAAATAADADGARSPTPSGGGRGGKGKKSWSFK